MAGQQECDGLTRFRGKSGTQFPSGRSFAESDERAWLPEGRRPRQTAGWYTFNIRLLRQEPFERSSNSLEPCRSRTGFDGHYPGQREVFAANRSSRKRWTSSGKLVPGNWKTNKQSAWP